jgi:hypothetical protein
MIRAEAGCAEEIQGTIYLNLCYTDALGSSCEEKLGVIPHKRANSKGWDHGEGTPETYPAAPGILISQ